MTEQVIQEMIRETEKVIRAINSPPSTVTASGRRRTLLLETKLSTLKSVLPIIKTKDGEIQELRDKWDADVRKKFLTVCKDYISKAAVEKAIDNLSIYSICTTATVDGEESDALWSAMDTYTDRLKDHLRKELGLSTSEEQH